MWAIWWCSLIVIIGRKFFKDSPLFYFAVWMTMFFIPDDNNTAVYKFMLPFFILAYLFNKFDLTTRLKKIYSHKAFGFSALFAFLLLLPIFALLNRYRFHNFIRTAVYLILATYLCAVYAVVGLPDIAYYRFSPNINLEPFL